MGWIRLDDDFPNHPKAIAAGPDAAWLFVAGLCYCSHYETDGRIPKAAIKKLTSARKPDAISEQLVVVGLWDDEGGCYVVRNYLEYQRSKAEIEEIREARRHAGRLGGLSKARNKRLANSQANEVAKTYPHTHTQTPTHVERPKGESRCNYCESVLGPDGDCGICDVSRAHA